MYNKFKIPPTIAAEKDYANLILCVYDNNEYHVHMVLKEKFNKTIYENLLLDLTEFEEYVIMHGLTDTLYSIVPLNSGLSDFVAMFGFIIEGSLYDNKGNEVYLKMKKELKQCHQQQ
jgi:hypothetical protein